MILLKPSLCSLILKFVNKKSAAIYKLAELKVSVLRKQFFEKVKVFLRGLFMILRNTKQCSIRLFAFGNTAQKSILRIGFSEFRRGRAFLTDGSFER